LSPTAPLAGVPLLVKDVDVSVSEWPTTYSSRFYDDAPLRPDSEIVCRWRAAGVILLGKTNTPEFADDFATEPVLRGTTFNPWDLTRTVGGSSGGSAAAVASGMVPVAHGSDVGGSIRVPAACCGLFGLKPSRGLNPSGPYFDALGGGLNAQHVLTRSVRDSAAFLDATAGAEPGGWTTRAVPRGHYAASLTSTPPPLRVLSIARLFEGQEVDPEIDARRQVMESMLRDQGHTVVAGQFPPELLPRTEGDSWTLLWMADIAGAIDRQRARLGRDPRSDELEPLARWIYDHVRRKTVSDYLIAQQVAHRVAAVVESAFTSVDLLITPTTASLPPLVGSFGTGEKNFDYAAWASAAYGFAPFTEIFNVTGRPAASLPLGVSGQGLPIGMQLVGRPNEEALLLQVASQLERDSAWTRSHPPIWGSAPG
jgi:amidase